MKKHFKKVIEYVRENKTWSEAEEQVALERIDRWRCPLDHAYPSISDEISELMCEYGVENDLPEDWCEDFDAEDIFWKL